MKSIRSLNEVKAERLETLQVSRVYSPERTTRLTGGFDFVLVAGFRLRSWLWSGVGYGVGENVIGGGTVAGGRLIFCKKSGVCENIND